MANAADIATALLERCSTLSVGSPTLSIAYPEVTFIPPVDDDGNTLPYLDCRLFMNGQLWTGLSVGKVDVGILQLMIVAPRNRGVLTFIEIADAVAAHFPAAFRAPPVKFQEPFIGSPISEADKLLITVRMPWTA